MNCSVFMKKDMYNFTFTVQLEPGANTPGRPAYKLCWHNHSSFRGYYYTYYKGTKLLRDTKPCDIVNWDKVQLKRRVASPSQLLLRQIKMKEFQKRAQNVNYSLV